MHAPTSTSGAPHAPAGVRLLERAWMPVAVLLFASCLWGLTWWPLKGFALQGLSGPALAMLTYGGAGLLGLPLLWHQRRHWRQHTTLVVLIGLVGGWGNTAFVSALVQGDVVRVMLLFYLAPMWSVLGGRIFLGEQVSARRSVAVALSLGGAFLVVGGMAAFHSAPSAADLLAVSAGLAFTGNNILARKAQGVPSGTKSVALLLGCGLTSLALLLWLAAGAGDAPRTVLVWPVFTAQLVVLLAAFAVLWMGLVTYTWQWSVTRLEAGRSGVIAIAELVVALLTATLWGGESLSATEYLGAALIATAALLEATHAGSAPEALARPPTEDPA